MEVRIKYSSFESKEFKSLGQKGLNQTIEVFKKFPWSDEISKIENKKEQITYPIIKLIKDNKEYLEINGFIKNGQILFNSKMKYKKTIWRVIIGLQYSDSDVIELISDYFKKSTIDVINKTETIRFLQNSSVMDLMIYNFGDKDILVDFDKNIKRDFEYSFKLSKAFRKSYLSFLFLLMPLGFQIYFSINGSPIDYKSFLWLQLILGLFALPGIILVINHSVKSKNLKLYFQKNNNTFIVIEDQTKLIYDKTQIESITKFSTNASDRAPWGMFDYWEIKMKNRKRILISDMLINEMDFMKHFDILITEKDTKKKFLPLIE